MTIQNVWIRELFVFSKLLERVNEKCLPVAGMNYLLHEMFTFCKWVIKSFCIESERKVGNPEEAIISITSYVYFWKKKNNYRNTMPCYSNLWLIVVWTSSFFLWPCKCSMRGNFSFLSQVTEKEAFLPLSNLWKKRILCWACCFCYLISLVRGPNFVFVSQTLNFFSGRKGQCSATTREASQVILQFLFL